MTINKVLLIISVILFVLAALNVGLGAINLLPLGLDFMAGAGIV